MSIGATRRCTKEWKEAVSKRVKQQHRQGKFGRKTWKDSVKIIHCLLAANGAGKTTIVRLMVSQFRHSVVNIYEKEKWDVIQNSFVKGVKRPSDKALIVGEYGRRKIGGADQLRRKEFWKALEAAIKFKGADNIVVEALKIADPWYFHALEDFCAKHGCKLHSTLIKVDPMICFQRQLKRAAENATYPIETVMARHVRAKYVWGTIDDDQKSVIENSGDPNTAAKDLFKIIFN